MTIFKSHVGQLVYQVSHFYWTSVSIFQFNVNLISFCAILFIRLWVHFATIELKPKLTDTQCRYRESNPSSRGQRGTASYATCFPLKRKQVASGIRYFSGHYYGRHHGVIDMCRASKYREKEVRHYL